MLSLPLGSNIKIIKWAPQNDILGHPAVGVFLTQGGINSLYEAAYHAKPIVTIPLIADQEGNAVTVCVLTEMYMLLCYLMVVGVLAGHHGHMLAMVDILFLISSNCWCLLLVLKLYMQYPMSLQAQLTDGPLYKHHVSARDRKFVKSLHPDMAAAAFWGFHGSNWKSCLQDGSSVVA